MEVIYSAEPGDLDRPAYEAATERPGRPIRIRLQPTIYRLRGESGSGQQQAWPGVSWILECPTPEDALALREALRAFFEAVRARGPAAVTAQLGDALTDGLGEAPVGELSG